MHLEPCTHCERHVRSTETRCPFCQTPREATELAPPDYFSAIPRMSRGMMLALSAAMALQGALPEPSAEACEQQDPVFRFAQAGSAGARYGVPPSVGIGLYGAPSPQSRPMMELLASAVPVSARDGAARPRPHVQRTLQTLLPRLRRCYALQLQQTPALRLDLRVRLVIAADGSVSEVVTEGTPVGAVVDPCVRASLRASTFPPATRETQHRVRLRGRTQ